ncbi:restriction endonuclease subunit S [Vibrio lentus]|uniref:restriction endonuclease subunit S n=1 Tax=Vibrio sp. Vb339 TaxID=1192013 RepID=UPI001F52E55F|nr:MULTISPECIES: restriction endonuclease subunit S [Vibrio]
MSVEQISMNQLITDNIDIWTSTVKTKSASGRGSSKKRELYGVKKLRELILELAVRGKLVPQDPTDEPASALLERIAAEKAQLVKEKKIKKSKLLPKISDEEKLFELPLGWQWTKLGNVATLKGGFAYKSKEFVDSGIHQVIRMGNVRPDEFLLDQKTVFIEQDYAEMTSEYQLSESDVLLTMTGTKGKRDYLYSLVVSETHLNGRKLYLNQRLCSLSSVFCFPKFINVAVKSNTLLDTIYCKSTGTANQSNIGMDAISNWVVPIAPLNEQHRIVAKVDELMTLCDQLEQQTEASITAHQVLVTTLLDTLTNSANAEELMQNWARISEHFDTLFTAEASIDQLKQTILQLAVMGKLVPQDPNDEPATNLLERIAEEKAQLIKDKKIKKQKALPPIADDEKPFELPSGWEWCRLGDLAEFQKGYAFKSKDYLSEGLMITKIQNLTENSTRNSVYISAETLDEYEQFSLFKGDIVMTTVGSWFSAPLSAVGRTFVINEKFDQSLLNQNAVRIRVWKELNPMFSYSYLNSNFFKDYLVNEAQGTANQASITQLSIKNFFMCIPPKNEQNRITAKITELVAICDQLKARLKESQSTQFHLTDAIIEQAV